MPSDVVVLKHCRCMDCRNFSADGAGNYYCSELIGGTAVVWATGRRFCDPPPDAWHYCARYHGPQISTDVWMWPHAAKKRPVPGGGRPSDEPTSFRLAGGNQPVAPDCRPDATDVKAQPNAQGRAPTRQVGAGSNVPADPAGPTTPAEGRDVGEPGANGSSLADQAGARGGNSRRTDHSLFSEKNTSWTRR